MPVDSPATFELRGQFAGFFRTIFGKRRMILRAGGEDHELKVPKELRRELAGALVPGVEIVVTGFERPEDFTGRMRRVVSHIHFLTRPPVPPDACATCTIRVCTKKNCWKQGGRELWHTLETRLAEQGLTDAVRLKAVDCLDNCKRAPNLELHHRLHQRGTPARVGEIVAQIAAELGRAKP